MGHNWKKPLIGPCHDMESTSKLTRTERNIEARKRAKLEEEGRREDSTGLLGHVKRRLLGANVKPEDVEYVLGLVRYDMAESRPAKDIDAMVNKYCWQAAKAAGSIQEGESE